MFNLIDFESSRPCDKALMSQKDGFSFPSATWYKPFNGLHYADGKKKCLIVRKVTLNFTYESLGLDGSNSNRCVLGWHDKMQMIALPLKEMRPVIHRNGNQEFSGWDKLYWESRPWTDVFSKYFTCIFL